MAGEYAILNPRSRRRHRRRRRARPRARRHVVRRRRRRHNPYLMNARRRSRRGRRRVGRRVTRRRRNPSHALGGFKVAGIDLGAAALIAAGAIGSELATGVVASQAFIPEQVKTGVGRMALKAGVGIGAGMLARRFVGPRVGNLLMLGVGAGLVIDVYRTYVAPNVPGLSDYDQFSGYAPAGSFPLGGAEDFEAGELGGVVEDRASFDED
jgi:hypothetical protein